MVFEKKKKVKKIFFITEQKDKNICVNTSNATLRHFKQTKRMFAVKKPFQFVDVLIYLLSNCSLLTTIQSFSLLYSTVDAVSLRMDSNEKLC